MQFVFVLAVLLYSVIVSFMANCFALIQSAFHLLYAIIPLFLIINIFAGTLIINAKSRKIRVCSHGTVLLYAFCFSAAVSVAFHIMLALRIIADSPMTFVWSAVVCVCVNAVIFWNGIICVYLTSTQLGIKLRLIGLICGMIPIANLVVLAFILRTTTRECFFEAEKERINRKRKQENICGTRYPILMVHGVFFRDSKYFNYWGRIPKELEANGAKVFYGNHQSAASVPDSAEELKIRIAGLLAETGAEKVNIIAHSKGGLDCRYAIAKLGIGPDVASLTTINTPHKGCLFADDLLTKIPEDVKSRVAAAYNTALKKFGDSNPDFLAAVNNLTDQYCQQLNEELPTPGDIYCQSVGSVMTKATGGKFPLNFSYHLVKYYDGENDGLVSEKSFSWGERYLCLRPSKKRGISHGDMIDLNRENVPGFDVREFYVQLVHDLKVRGL